MQDSDGFSDPAGYTGDGIKFADVPDGLGALSKVPAASDPAEKPRKLEAEIEDGSLAMLAIIGMICHNDLTGSARGEWALCTGSLLGSGHVGKRACGSPVTIVSRRLEKGSSRGPSLLFVALLCLIILFCHTLAFLRPIILLLCCS